MNPTAIFSKTGKGVQEASGKTSNLSRADRAVLKEIDGKTALQNIAVKFEKISADKFDALIAQFDKDGYIREVSSGASAPTPVARTAPPPPKAPPPKAPPSGDEEDEMDFTQAIKLPPKSAPAAPKAPVDLAAASRAESERKEKEQQALDYKSRQESEAKAKAEGEARARVEAQARAAAEAKARAEAEARAAAEAKARGEAEAKVKAARDAALRMATEAKAKADAEVKAKAKLEAELTGKLEAERKAREEAERRAADASELARKELEEKAKRDADELRQRLEAEMKAKLDEERKAREAEDRKRREEEDQRRAEEDRKRREDDERRRKEDEERRAKEAEERRAREEADRKKREEEDRRRAEEDARRRKEEEERRAKEVEERKAREEADRKRREEDDRKRAEEDQRRKDDDARRAREDADRRTKDDTERRAKEDSDRRAKDESDRRAREDAEEKARAARAAASQSAPTPAAASVPPPPPPAASGGFGDSLLADLDSFGKREEEEQKAKEEADRKAKEEAERKARAEAERKAKEEAERKAKAEAERKAKEEAERKAQEEAEQKAREEEERKKQEEAERKRKAKESLAAKEAERKAALGASAPKPAPKPAARPAAKAPASGDDDIGVTDDDLDMDDVKSDEKALSATARKAQREKEQAAAIASAPAPRPKNWGKLGAIAMFVLLIGGVAVLNLMPVSTSEYEKAASDAMGVPVKIGSARLSVLTGIEAKFDAVSIGDAVKIRTVRGYPDFGSLMGGKKSFSRIELEGVSLSQSDLADAMLGKVAGENFRVGRILVKQAKLEGPLTLPALDVEAIVSGDGSLQSVSLKGGDKLVVQLSPKGNDIGFEISAGSLALPFAPGLTLSDFGMKGTANRTGVVASEFDGRASDGVVTGTAKIRWGANWTVDGEVRVRNLRVAVLAPALVSEGKAEGRGAYSMSGPRPAALFETARIQGEFKIEQGVLGSFDLTRALQTGGAQSSGRTVFSELTGQVVYDKGAIKVTNASLTAGAMNAGASLDVDANGGLSGRVVADVKTPTQTLRATLNLSGKIQDPVIRK